MFLMSQETGRDRWVPWDWTYKWLGATMWVLRIKPRSCGRAYVLLTTELSPHVSLPLKLKELWEKSVPIYLKSMRSNV